MPSQCKRAGEVQQQQQLTGGRSGRAGSGAPCCLATALTHACRALPARHHTHSTPLPAQMRVYDDESDESKHRREEIAALGASNPTAVYT